MCSSDLPGPQGMTTANDWTKEMSTKGFPELQKHYALLGAPKNVMLHRGEHFPHNYNSVSRSAFFTWLNQHFRLGAKEPVLERDFTPLSGEVWGTEPAATYVFGWELAREWRFDAAIRYVLADSREGLFDRWTPSAVLRMPVTERWEVHAEWFGTWSERLEDETVQPFVGPGTHFMIAPNFEIGCRMGWGLTQDAASYYVDSGLGWLF